MVYLVLKCVLKHYCLICFSYRNLREIIRSWNRSRKWSRFPLAVWKWNHICCMSAPFYSFYKSFESSIRTDFPLQLQKKASQKTLPIRVTLGDAVACPALVGHFSHPVFCNFAYWHIPQLILKKISMFLENPQHFLDGVFKFSTAFSHRSRNTLPVYIK